MQNTIEKQIELNAPVEKVWRALTDYKEFGAWFGVDVENAFAAGKTVKGRKTSPGCGNMPWQATIKTMDKPRLFAYTWHPYTADPNHDTSKEPQTLVEFRLEANKKGTLLTVTESGFVSLSKQRMSEAFPKHTEGWGIQMENIRNHVES